MSKPQLPVGMYYCGITGQPFDESTHPQLGLRLHPDDVAGEATDDGKPIAPGHYLASGKMAKRFRPKIAARLSSGSDENAIAFQQHVLRNSGFSVEQVAELVDKATDKVAAVRSLKAHGMTAEAAALEAKPTALAEVIKQRGIDPLPFCDGPWLQ